MRYSFTRKLCFLMVFLCAATSAVMAQKTITGKVTGAADGTGLPGVNVTVPGTSSGASTDTKGNYTLSLPAGAKSVLFSFIGYEPQTITVGDKSVINVSLSATTKGLGEVVVVGYGVQTRRDVTGTIASVKGADIKNIPVPDAASAIQGRVTGVDIVRSDGAPGSTPAIRIRGTGTINNADPLVIIDGIPASGISDVNPTTLRLWKY